MRTVNYQPDEEPAPTFSFGGSAAHYAAIYGISIGTARQRLEARIVEKEQILARLNDPSWKAPPPAPPPPPVIELPLMPVPGSAQLRPEHVLKVAAERANFPYGFFMQSKHRHRPLAYSRGAAATMIKLLFPQLSTPKIAKFWGMDHTSVMHMLRAHNKRMHSPAYAALWDALSKTFAAPPLTTEKDDGAECRSGGNAEQPAEAAAD